jgi:Lon protease-like protein
MSEPLALLSLPLFPLGTMLFPGGLLPLRIFEVRYLDMIGKCHKAGAPFGVVTLIKGSEVRRPGSDGSPGEVLAQETFLPVGTLATITELTKPQAGLMEIRCTGTQRFRINQTEMLKHGLWVANVALLDDDQPVAIPDDLKGVALALAKLVDSLHARDIPAAQMPVLQPYRYDDCAWVANRWCELLPLAPKQKQGLLALDSPLVRLELISDVLARHGIAI